MLSKISWSLFLGGLVIVVVGYYLFVFTFYFKKESINLIKKMGSPKLIHQSNSSNGKSFATATTEKVNQDNDQFTLVHELMEDLKEVFTRLEKSVPVKEELVQSVKTALKKYPELNVTDLKEDISVHVTQEAKERCAIDLFPEDVKRIWKE